LSENREIGVASLECHGFGGKALDHPPFSFDSVALRTLAELPLEAC
jgi:hypothetical protein